MKIKWMQNASNVEGRIYIQWSSNTKNMTNEENHVLSLHPQPSFEEILLEKITHADANYYNSVHPWIMCHVFARYKTPAKDRNLCIHPWHTAGMCGVWVRKMTDLNKVRARNKTCSKESNSLLTFDIQLNMVSKSTREGWLIWKHQSLWEINPNIITLKEANVSK
jgi:hypothetical protein